MSECDAIRTTVKHHSERPMELQPESAAGLLIGLYRIYKNPPPEMAADPCAKARAEGVLAGSLSAVRARGDLYSGAVDLSMEVKDPDVARLLGKAEIEPEGHIVFR